MTSEPTYGGEPGGTTGDRIEGLPALDRGRYAAAVAAYEREGDGAPADPGRLAWRAEVALYLGRFGEARDAAGRVESGADDGALLRRARLILAEVAFFEGHLNEAEALVGPVFDLARTAGDALAEMRARYDLGRFATKRSEHALAIEHLAAASRLASDLGNEFYQGLIAFHRAVSLYELNEAAAAERRCVEAIALLEASENLRYRALAQSVYGALLTDLGRFSEGLAALERAEATAVALGVVHDVQAVRANVARAMLSLGRYDEAVERLEHLLDAARSVGGHDAELLALGLLAHAELSRGRPEAAERAAAEAVQLATLVGSAEDIRDKRQVAARARARLGREGAVDELRALLAEVDRDGPDEQRAEARIYLAEALISEDPVTAERLLAEARRMPVVAAAEWLRGALDRVDAERLRAPVHVSRDGSLVINPRLGWPKLKSAREALERFLVNGALAETDGNAAAAGRLLGETRYQMHYLKRIFEHGEGRPSRRRGDPEDEAGAAESRPARPKRLVRRN
jgi:tetratricopeptide (TPR) repeat protein